MSNSNDHQSTMLDEQLELEGRNEMACKLT